MFSYEVRRNTLTVWLDGELDDRAAGRLRTEIDAIMDESRVKRLVFDVSDLDFMDSSGIGLIIGRYKKLSQRGGSAAVKGMDRRIDRLFQMSGVYQVVERL